MTEEIKKQINQCLKSLRDYREQLMALPDDGIGKPHSHGETDNSRGLRIRAVSIAITEMETSAKYFADSTIEELKEYYV